MCEISYFMKPLEISVNSRSYCFTRGLREITKIPRHFTKSLKISKPFFTILLILLRPASVNQYNTDFSKNMISRTCWWFG